MWSVRVSDNTDCGLRDFLAVCDIAASHQEQMPMEESGNMVSWDMYYST